MAGTAGREESKCLQLGLVVGTLFGQFDSQSDPVDLNMNLPCGHPFFELDRNHLMKYISVTYHAPNEVQSCQGREAH